MHAVEKGTIAVTSDIARSDSGDSSDRIRLLVLWATLPGYMVACLSKLVSKYPVDLMVVHVTRKGGAPFADELYSSIPRRIAWDPGQASPDMRSRLRRAAVEFKPDICVVCGWDVATYNRLVAELKEHGTTVVCTCDNMWRATLRQRIGVLWGRLTFGARYDYVWVPGERGAQLVRRMGFRSGRIWLGLYSADVENFAGLLEHRLLNPWPKRFLFVGNVNRNKGIAYLVKAYHKYRRQVRDPWELWCAGRGPLRHELDGREGVRPLGFVQPSELADVMARAGALVLPSYRDNWPLVIHEATTAGLPIICSFQCGNSVELVQDGYNGLVFEAGDVDGLCRAMKHLSELPAIEEWGRRSAQMAARYSPERWADYFWNKARAL